MKDVYMELWKAAVGHTGKLTTPILDYIANYGTFVLAAIRQKAVKAFQGLSISVSALHRHLFRSAR
jgi:hypothetical protein